MSYAFWGWCLGCFPRMADTGRQIWEGSRVGEAEGVTWGYSGGMRWKPVRLTRLFEAKADMGPGLSWGSVTQSPQILIVIIIPAVKILCTRHFPRTSGREVGTIIYPQVPREHIGSDMACQRW